MSVLPSHRYRHAAHLPAFPTRRSSDLAYSEKRQFIRLPVDVPVTIEHDGQVMTAMCRNLSGSGRLAIADCADRKSTRLNSSHVATSYAVFCLKQKNKRRE